MSYKSAYNGKRLQEINLHEIQDNSSSSSEEGELDNDYSNSYTSKNWTSEVLYKKIMQERKKSGLIELKMPTR